MHAELVGEQVPAACRLDGVEVADHVGDRHIGRGELLDVAVFALDPRDRGRVTALGHQVAPELADRAEGIVVDLAPRNDRHDGIEQFHQGPEDARLRLSPEAKQDEIVLRQDGIDDLGQHRVLVADHTLEQGGAGVEGMKQVGPEFLADGAGGPVPGTVLEVVERMWLGHD